MWKVRTGALILLILGILTGLFVYTSETGSFSDKFAFKLGLDLDEGAHLTYRADTSGIDPSDVDNSMDVLRQTIERRVNIFNVSEPIVQVEKGGKFSKSEDANRLIVELPGITDISKAIEQIGKTPILEFRLQRNITDYASLSDEEITSLTIDDIYEPAILTGAQLKRAQLQFDSITGEPIVSVIYNDAGRDILKEVTGSNIGRIMAIFLDGELISSPVIRDEIVNGQATISGSFTPEEGKDLVRNLNFGALPLPIELIETQTIGATLGKETLYRGIDALLIGFAFIFVFLILIYRLPGLIATFSLAIYVALMLLLFKVIPVTLTASGLAGFILSIGMAVDANILIFERMKEELKKGVSIYDAVKEGSARAWTSIRDGNLTSIISAIVLYWMSGTSLVKGFALVFGIGVLVSMFTAVFVSKIFLLAFSSKKKFAPSAVNLNKE